MTPIRIRPVDDEARRMVFRARILCEPTDFVASKAELFIGEYEGRQEVYLRLRGIPDKGGAQEEYELIIPFNHVRSARVCDKTKGSPPAGSDDDLQVFEVYPDIG